MGLQNGTKISKKCTRNLEVKVKKKKKKNRMHRRKAKSPVNRSSFFNLCIFGIIKTIILPRRMVIDLEYVVLFFELFVFLDG